MIPSRNALFKRMFNLYLPLSPLQLFVKLQLQEIQVRKEIRHNNIHTLIEGGWSRESLQSQ